MNTDKLLIITAVASALIIGVMANYLLNLNTHTKEVDNIQAAYHHTMNIAEADAMLNQCIADREALYLSLIHI